MFYYVQCHIGSRERWSQTRDKLWIAILLQSDSIWIHSELRLLSVLGVWHNATICLCLFSVSHIQILIYIQTCLWSIPPCLCLYTEKHRKWVPGERYGYWKWWIQFSVLISATSHNWSQWDVLNSVYSALIVSLKNPVSSQ